jgi:NADP-dependent 3-hydroxy acid dehydrogenase YdfG
MTSGALHGRVALVTGASRGIGLAIARALAGAGAQVAMLARSRDVLEHEAAALAPLAFAVPCDLASAADITRALDEVKATRGLPDILVNNAGTFALAPVGALPAGAAGEVMAVNLLAPFHLANALVPHLRAIARGHVVTIGSVADRSTYPENANYAASKHGARALHEMLRDELRGSGVRASLVSPGPVDTPLWDPVGPDTRAGFTPRAAMLPADAVAEAVLWVLTRPPAVNIDELRMSRA